MLVNLPTIQEECPSSGVSGVRLRRERSEDFLKISSEDFGTSGGVRDSLIMIVTSSSGALDLLDKRCISEDLRWKTLSESMVLDTNVLFSTGVVGRLRRRNVLGYGRSCVYRKHNTVIGTLYVNPIYRSRQRERRPRIPDT